MACRLVARAQLREEDDFPQRAPAGEKHQQSVDADAETTGGRHAVLEGEDEVVVQLVSFLVARRAVRRLLEEAGALVLGVVQLAEGVCYLYTPGEGLESLDEARVVRLARCGTNSIPPTKSSAFRASH